ncbi:Beta-ketoacyl-acyl-carrier-protein synthase I [Pseudomonas sp. 37 R 15]|nr:Beta-ketoacyl-acyl-carrier-protein synthase I [Pseudomonas sp. 37 R 15]
MGPVMERIAIIGMSLRLPGANDAEQYWQNLCEGKDCITAVPADRWNNAYIPPLHHRDRRSSAATQWGGFLEGIDQFDAAFFNISPREAEKLDPQQRLLLEMSWHLIERTHYTAYSLRGSNTGVFIGASGWDFNKILNRDINLMEGYVGTGSTLSPLANRISYQFDFQGPSMVVDTACSSSLSAIHLACAHLNAGECDLAIAGGINVILAPETNLAFAAAGFMSPTGRCQTFSASADGYVRSEGAGLVMLKPYARALAEGDEILGIIRGSAINQDGMTNGLTAPSAKAQEQVIARALRQAAVQPQDVSYIETHGTGTPLGDPIEIKALSKVYGGGQASIVTPCLLGAVKANIGHCESGAGMAGLLKILLMFKHQLIPPQIHIGQLNPLIDEFLDHTRLKIVTALSAWQPDNKRIAGLSAFGFGGTNTHMVLEEPPAACAGERSWVEGAGVLKITAHSEYSIKAIARAYADYLKPTHRGAQTLTYTANRYRADLSIRKAIAFLNKADLCEKLRSFSNGADRPKAFGKRPKCVFLFTGQGSHYPGMGTMPYAAFEVFRQAIDECEAITMANHGLSIKTLVLESDTAVLRKTINCQPAIFCLEYALAKLWISLGVKPRYLIGHSLGEYAACCIAQVFSLADALRLVVSRARLMEQMTAPGAMLCVLASTRDVEALLERCCFEPEQAVVIAADNSQHQTVVSGPLPAVKRFQCLLDTLPMQWVELRVEKAFHSPSMLPASLAFEAVAASVTYGAPQVPIIANLTGLPADGGTFNADYFCQHMHQRVRFRESIENLLGKGTYIGLEVGPGAALNAVCQPFSRFAMCSSLAKETQTQLYRAVSWLYERGVPIEWAALCASAAPRPEPVMDIPVYAFERTSFRPVFSDAPVMLIPQNGPNTGIVFSQPFFTPTIAPGAAGLADSAPKVGEPQGRAAHDMTSIIALSLGLEAQTLDKTASFRMLGLTSFMAVELLLKIKSTFGLDLKPQDLFEHHSVARLEAFIQQSLTHPAAAYTAPVPELPAAHLSASRHQVRFMDRELLINGYRINVCQWGEDRQPAVLLIHGLLDQAYSWHDMALHLVAAGYRVIAPDLRGHGLSSHIEDGKGYQLVDYVSDITLLCDALALTQVHVVGHSLGSVLAALFANQNRQWVRTLFLLETFIPPTVDVLDMELQIAKELHHLRTTPSQPLIRSVAEAVQLIKMSYMTVSDSFARQLCERVLSGDDEHGYRWRWDARLRSRVGLRFHGLRKHYVDLLNGISAPAALYFGQKSNFSSAAEKTALQRSLADCQVINFDAGHNIQIECANELAQHILQTLGALERT